MTRTARRRWSRELESQVDGIALGETGPVLLHVYDFPAGGKWIDNVIPGRLGALDRQTGETIWQSPCEVGYGRGFGAGIGGEDEAVVLGPSQNGHRIVRMALASGELIGASEIEEFDEAVVFPDVCLCLNARRAFAIDTRSMVEVWSYAREGERYHRLARLGESVFVVFSRRAEGTTGVLRLDVECGEPAELALPASHARIHEVVADAGVVAVLADGSAFDLAAGAGLDAARLALAEDDDDLGSDSISLLALPRDVEAGAAPLWGATVEQGAFDEPTDVSVQSDSGKLYAARGAYLRAFDILSGRPLGELTLPGLDENVAWRVCQGAGLLAEETRLSVFEVPV